MCSARGCWGHGSGEKKSRTPQQLDCVARTIYSTAHVISSGITPESLRCSVTIRSESPATGVAYHELLALRSLANRFTFRWSLTTARRDGASLVNQGGYSLTHVVRTMRLPVYDRHRSYDTTYSQTWSQNGIVSYVGYDNLQVVSARLFTFRFFLHSTRT